MALLADATVRAGVLVRARTGLGDLLCTVPALRALRARLPDAHIALLSYAEMRPVVDRMRAWVDELLPFPGWPGIPERPVDVRALAPFLAAVRERRFDLAVQMYGGNPAANEVTERLGAARTAGFLVPGTAAPDPAGHMAYPHGRHEIDRHLDLMALLGAPSTGAALEFPIEPRDESEAAAVRADAGLGSGPYALLHPGATSPSRRWPVERWARVADALAARGLTVGVTGVPSERDAASAVCRRMRSPSANLCGRTTLGGFAALLRGAALLAGNDSGPAHLAAAVGVPSVVVFLSGDPVRWAHPGAQHRVARADVGCNPCPHLSCPIDHRCAARVTVPAVVAEVDAALAARSSRLPATAQ